ncbi:unnamed protein product, partial [Amoebophrya sp. A25]
EYLEQLSEEGNSGSVVWILQKHCQNFTVPAGSERACSPGRIRFEYEGSEKINRTSETS